MMLQPTEPYQPGPVLLLFFNVVISALCVKTAEIRWFLYLHLIAVEFLSFILEGSPGLDLSHCRRYVALEKDATKKGAIMAGK